MKYRTFGIVTAAILGIQVMPAPAAEKGLDYEFYKSRVEPIFLKKRGDHVRCFVCHADSNNALKLEKLTPGNKTWTEEQTRHNFETVSKLVIPSNPGESPLLLHPLAINAGGHAYHSGGRQFPNKNDPDWKTFAQWAGALKPAGK